MMVKRVTLVAVTITILLVSLVLGEPDGGGDNDTHHLEEEEDDHYIRTIGNYTIYVPKPRTCLPGQFKCAKSEECIPQGWLCDGEPDCGRIHRHGVGVGEDNETVFSLPPGMTWDQWSPVDTSDESVDLCQYIHSCPPQHFRCDNLITCIHFEQVCDGHNHCSDGSDERAFCANQTACEQMHCEYACRALPKGSECFCKSGTELINGTHCSGSRTNSSVNLQCDQGSHLVNESCVPETVPQEGLPPMFVFNLGHELVFTTGNGNTVGRISNDLDHQIISYAVNYANQSVCYLKRHHTWNRNFELERAPGDKWMEEYDKVFCGRWTDPTEVWVHSIQSPLYSALNTHQLVYEWIGSKWYMMSMDLDTIYACNATFGMCATIVDTAITPRMIAVDSNAGYLIVAESNRDSKVTRYHLDGTHREVIVSVGISYTISILLDLESQLLYWYDRTHGGLSSISYTNPGARATELGGKFTSFGVFRARFYFLRNNSLEVTHPLNSLSVWTRVEIEKSVLKQAKDFRLLYSQEEWSHPCATDNGGCQHLCTVGYEDNEMGTHRGVARCLCSPGYHLQEKTRCVLDQSEFKLIYSRYYLDQSIMVVPLPEGGKELNGQHDVATVTHFKVPLVRDTQVTVLDYDPVTQTIYYADFRRSAIYQYRFEANATQVKFPTVFTTHRVMEVRCLAVDIRGRNIYWGDTRTKSISVARIDNSTIRRTLLTLRMRPWLMQIDHQSSWLFWAEYPYNIMPQYESSRPRIVRAWLDGSHRETVVASLYQIPFGLAIDATRAQLYWLVGLELERSALDGRDREMVANFSGAPFRAYKVISSFELFRGTLYFASSENRGLWTLNEKNDWSTKQVQALIDNAYVHNFKIIYKKTEIGKNPCSEKGCEQLCFLSPEQATCACASGYHLKEDKKSCEPLANYTESEICPENYFECKKMTECIEMKHVCDGESDCRDKSDEDNSPGGTCSKFQCPEDHFRCDGNRCVTNRWVCDGQHDCLDGTDELQFEGCTKHSCAQGSFRCASAGRCIPQAWVCDGEVDCATNGPNDQSDEFNCTLPECDMITQFQCDNKRCVDLRYVCDGDNDCRDGSDEKNCPAQDIDCPRPTHFQCAAGRKCLPKFLRCDGIVDCIDGSDELNCTYQNSKYNCSNTESNREFQCNTGACISASLRCDGKMDCPDGSDEARCIRIECRTDEFYCAELDVCFSAQVRCNGVLDCPDGSDELSCSPNFLDTNKPCHYPNQTCTSRATNRTICLDISKFCDNRVDCADGSDEGPHCHDDMCFFSQCAGHCHNVPHEPGYVCYCAKGLELAVDGVSCTSAHPCDQWGVCAQSCTSLGLFYHCHCVEGYVMDPKDNFTCKSISEVSPQIIFSNRHDIRSINLNTNSANVLLTGLKNTIAIDYLYRKEGVLIFWTDVMDNRIYRGELIHHSITNIETIVEGGLAFAEGLAVDWIALNLYWVDSNFDQIEVANLNGTLRKTLIAGNLSSPRAITVDPAEATLFWTDWDSEAPRIEAASMDGTERRLVVKIKPGSWPNGIALDSIARRIYWIDAKSDALSCVRYDGKDLRTILTGNQYLSHPFAVNLFENNVYWSDWRTNSLVRANKWNGTQVQVVINTFTNPFDVKIIHPSRQPLLPKGTRSPCSDQNGGCTHLCLLSRNSKGYSCDCPHSMRLAADGQSCLLNEVFLLVGKMNELRGVDLDRPGFFSHPPITLPTVLHPVQVEYVARTKHIYWANLQLNEIKRASLINGRAETVIEQVIDKPLSIAIDWITSNLFVLSEKSDDWTPLRHFDSESEPDNDHEEDELEWSEQPQVKSLHRSSTRQPRLFVCNLEGEYISQITPEAHFSEPQSLAIDPINAWMFWSENVIEHRPRNGTTTNETVNHHRSIIVRSRMDGSEVRIIADSATTPNLDQATSLNLDLYDLQQPRLYWVNLGSHSIQYLELAKPNFPVTTVYPGVNVTENLEPTALTIFGSRLFAAFHQDDSVRSMDKSTGGDLKPFLNYHDDLITLKIYDAKIQTGTNLCAVNRGNCSHLCLMVSPQKRKCLCTLGFVVDPRDQTQCIGQDVFLMYSWNWGLRGISVDVNNSENLNLTRQLEQKSKSARGTSLLPPMSKFLLASSIDFDFKTQTFFWTESDDGVIFSIQRDTSDFRPLVKDQERMVDFAYDWNARYLYWIEEEVGVIEVTRLNSTSKLVLASEEIFKPTSIALHPGLGLLFWSDLGGWPHNRIERSLLNGENRTVIYEVAKVRTIHCLVVDLEDDYLYFTDLSEKSILRIKFDESKGIHLPEVVVSNVKSPISLTIYGSHLYWADAMFLDGSILAVRKDQHKVTLAKNATEVNLLEAGLGDQVKDLTVFYDRPIYSANPCSRDNGGCEDFCFYLGNGIHHCACSYGYVDPQDGKQCREYDTFVFFSRVSEIDSFRIVEKNLTNQKFEPDMANSAYRVISSGNIRNVVALGYDFWRRRVFYSDIYKGTINWCHFNGTDHQVLLDRLGPVEGLVYDHNSHQLLWTSNTDPSVSVLDLTPLPYAAAGSSSLFNASKVRKIVQLSPQDRPRGIAVDSCRELIYWANWNAHEPSIQRAHVSGHALQSIITEGIRMPNAIAIDPTQHHFYWSDARLNKIERCDLDGFQCRILLRETSQHAFALAVFGEHLYWTDWATHSVMRCHKMTGSDVTTLRRNLPRPMGLVVVARPTGLDCLHTNPCQTGNGGCEDVCTIKLVKVSSYSLPECSCFAGRRLAKDGRRCQWVNSTCTAEHGHFGCHREGNCIPFELTCDGRTDCLDGSDEEVRYCAERQCPTNYHRCGSDRRCLHRDKICDGVVQCSDGSDERHCDCAKQGKFRCEANGVCIPESYRCNYAPDCPDGSDEWHCPAPNCTSLTSVEPKINCPKTPLCISPNWLCDGQNDCWDNSDEINCDQLHNKTTAHIEKHRTVKTNQTMNSTIECYEDQFRCGSNECLSVILGCDGSKDCQDGSDESPEFCRIRTCPKEYFKCVTTGKCVPKEWVCDGQHDCFDGSDERLEKPINGSDACPPVEPPLVSRLLCKPDEFRCQSGLCIARRLFCDGTDDCGDRSDESDQLCQAKRKNKLCSPTEYRCANKARCIPRTWLCNGISDCAGGDDESHQLCAPYLPSSNSNFSAHCRMDQFHCDSGSCIRAELVCDGQNDCGDFSDELQCNVNECQSGSVACAQICDNMPIGYRCRCNPGFEALDGGRICRDIDECESHVCSQLCTNTPGSYRCQCVSGYTLDEDGVTCHSDAPIPAKVLLTTTDGIHLVTPTIEGRNVTNVRLMLPSLRNTVALDFDWRENCLYWSEIGSKVAFIKRYCGSLDSLTSIPAAFVAMQEIQILHSNTLQSPDGLAVDWIGRNLYWCDKGKRAIEVSTLDGKFRKPLVGSDLLDEPRAIVVNPLEGLLFWSDWGEKPHLGRASMDGSDARVILEESLGWPNALSIDFIRRELYFADAREDYIALVDFEGRHRVVLFAGKSPYTGHIFALAYFEARLYWTDWHSNQLVSCPALNCTIEQFVPQVTVHRPMDVQVLHPDRQPSLPSGVKNPCHAGKGTGCLALCLLRPETSSSASSKRQNLTSVCACPENYVLSEDNVSCLANCTNSQFICATTYKCIPFWWKCDTQDDCGDGSDEPESCPVFHCNPGEFQCHNQQECLVPTQICDGIKNCPDGSDELDCDRHTCMPNQFKCPPSGNSSSYCLLKSYRCDGMPDCPGGEDEAHCGCPKNAFKCRNNRCISAEWECDGDDDCSDGSDEHEGCAQRKCPTNHFQCSQGRCVPNSWRCDGEPDCTDHEDESDCPPVNATCNENQFACGNQRCLDRIFRCDHDDDCGDGSDEVNCTIPTCASDQFRCTDGYKCLAKERRCDGVFNCFDRSDELNCPPVTCQEPHQFACSNGSLCILAEWRCDGDKDCPDGVDELNCSNSCSTRDFTCANSECIFGGWRCDGDRDCSDGSDEDSRLCLNLQCPPDHFRCMSTGVCLAMEKVCDGVAQCADGSDEELCHTILKDCTAIDRFLCHNKKLCIHRALKCNGIDNCGDGSDELDCLPVDNSTDMFHARPCPFGLCSQLCVTKKPYHTNSSIDNIDYYCLCAPGYRYVRLITSNLTKEVQQESTCNGHSSTMIMVSSDHGFRLINALMMHFVDEFTNLFRIRFQLYLNVTTNRSLVSRIESFDVLYDREHDIRHIVWTNPHRKALYRVEIKNLAYEVRIQNLVTNGKPRGLSEPVVLASDIENARGVAVDWNAQYVYWIDAGEDPAIRLVTINGDRRRTILTNPPLDQPNELVVHPKRCFIFWTDWGQTSIKIGRASLDGSSWRTLVTGGGEWPLALALDIEAERLYWCESKTGRIETVLFDGTDRRVVYTLESSIKPYRMDLWQDVLYLTTSNHHILLFDKFGRLPPRDSLGGRVPKLNHIVMLNNWKQQLVEDYICLKEPCPPSYMCIARTSTTKVCLCPDGFHEALNVKNVLECIPERHYTSPTPPVEAKNDCSNYGRARYSPDDTPNCECHPLYTGPRCETFRCMNHCFNHGLCYIDLSNVSQIYSPSDKPVGTLRCMCHFGFVGERCQTPITEELCQKGQVCLNNGTCEVGSRPSVRGPHSQPIRCRCQPNFSGEQCEACESDLTCLNGGHCASENGTWRCQCLPGFYGSQCQNHECSREYCNNHGRCQIKWKVMNYDVKYHETYPFNMRCECFDGFRGEHCEEKIKPPERTPSTTPSTTTTPAWQPTQAKCDLDVRCLNGGTCHNHDGVDKPVCECPIGFSGPLCEIKTSLDLDTESSEKKKAKSEEGGSVGGEKHRDLVAYTILAFIAIILGCLLIIRIQNSLRKKMQSELAFQHHRIDNTSVAESNVEIMNPIFDMNAPDEESSPTNNAQSELMVNYMNTNFANPIYDYKQLMSKEEEETANLLESTT